jgi:peptide/nickel transport system permease protein
MRQGTWVDALARFVSLFGYSVPIFWLGLLMLLLFYARLHWAPGPGRLDVMFQYTVKPVTGFALIDTWISGKAGAFRDALCASGPAGNVLALPCAGRHLRLTRAAILTELGQEYVTTARAKGAGLRVVFVHILPNIAGTLLTVIALAYASLLEGAVLTETVFAWPGIGRYLTTAMFSGDMPAILGATLVVGSSFVLLNALTDLAVCQHPRKGSAMSALTVPQIVRRHRRSPPLFARHRRPTGPPSSWSCCCMALLAPWLMRPTIPRCRKPRTG